MYNPAPVAIFAYNRSDHFQKTLEALASNLLASKTEITIFLDGPKNNEDRNQGCLIKKTATANSEKFKFLQIIESPENKGLADSIIAGVSEMCDRYGRTIVLEDDLITSKFFLDYMNEALCMYENDHQVASIHGYQHPVEEDLPESFFLKGGDCWGWGTWKRAWSTFNQNGIKLLEELKRKHLENAFDMDGALKNISMLKDQIQGKNNSWAIRWHASCYLNNMFTLHPGKSLIQNIGFDQSGTHCGFTHEFDVTPSTKKLSLCKQRVWENPNIREVFKKHFMKNQFSFTKQILHNMKTLAKISLRSLFRALIAKINNLKIKRSETKKKYWLWGDYPTWEAASAECSGYDEESILQKTIASTHSVLRGEASFERDSFLFEQPEVRWEVMAVMFEQMSRSHGYLSVLDFGGALGSLYNQHRQLFSRHKMVRWSVVEQPTYVNAGNKEFCTESLHFYNTAAECIMNQSPNVLLLSSVLSYLPDPYKLLHDLLDLQIPCLIIDRTILIESCDRLTVQRTPPYIYDASYPAWLLSREKLLSEVEGRGYTLQAEWEALDRLPVDGKEIQSSGIWFTLQS